MPRIKPMELVSPDVLDEMARQVLAREGAFHPSIRGVLNKILPSILEHVSPRELFQLVRHCIKLGIYEAARRQGPHFEQQIVKTRYKERERYKSRIADVVVALGGHTDDKS